MQGVEVLFAWWNSQEKLGEDYPKVSTSQGPHVCIQWTPVHGQKLCTCLPLGTSLLWAFCFVGTSFWRLSMSPCPLRNTGVSQRNAPFCEHVIWNRPSQILSATQKLAKSVLILKEWKSPEIMYG